MMILPAAIAESPDAAVARREEKTLQSIGGQRAISSFSGACGRTRPPLSKPVSCMFHSHAPPPADLDASWAFILLMWAVGFAA
jgi:hypothetical protein